MNPSTDALMGLTAEELRQLCELKTEQESLLNQLRAVNGKIAALLGGETSVRVPRDKTLGDRIVEQIKAAGTNGTTVPDIAVTTGKSQASIYGWIEKLRAKHPQLQSERNGARTIHKWIENTAS
jgi:hypothetical protein